MIRQPSVFADEVGTRSQSQVTDSNASLRKQHLTIMRAHTYKCIHTYIRMHMQGVILFISD